MSLLPNRADGLFRFFVWIFALECEKVCIFGGVNVMKTMSARRILAIVVGLLVVAAAMLGWLAWREHAVHSRLARVLCDTTLLRTGDLVFREGLGNESMLVTSVSNGEYSHVGLAVSTPSGWHVVHAVPGESPAGEPDYLKCEPIDSFFDPHRAMAGAMARVACSDDVARAAVAAAINKVEGLVEFDHRYDMDDTTQLYCTELVGLVYRRQGIDLIEERYAPTPGFGASGRVVYPEHLWQSPHLTVKKAFSITYITNPQKL